MTEANLFSVKLKGDRLQKCVATWDQVSSGFGKAPDEQTLRAPLLCSLWHCRAMEQDLAYYDRLPPGREEKSYDYLLRCAQAVPECSFFEELFRSIGGGWVNAADEGGDESKDRKVGTARAEKESI